jgi:F-type H+-transporting ATPase subunit delta
MSVIIPKAARRYAKALLEVALEQKKLETIYNDMSLVCNTITSSKELDLFLKSPIIKQDKKHNALKEIFGKKIDEISNTFFEIIIRKGREDLIFGISNAFIEAYKKHQGIIDVEVTSALDMSDKEIESLKKALEKKTGKTVLLSSKVDSSLIGGITIKIDDTVTDGSVKHKLDNLEELFYNNAV